MHSLQRAAGVAALVEALAYVVGFAAMAAWMRTDATDPAGKLAFVLAHKSAFQAWMLLIYLVAGSGLVLLALGLHERLRTGAPALMAVATAFALIWAGLVLGSGMVGIVGLESVATWHARDAAQATTAWLAIGAVQNGLGGGIELVGGVWLALVSLASRRARAMPPWLDVVGFATALAGLLSAHPALADLAAMFGLAQIVWFGGVGVWLLGGVAKARGLEFEVTR